MTKSNILISIVFIISLVGSILFFPIQLDGGHCCLAHKLAGSGGHTGISPAVEMAGHHHSDKLDTYLHQYVMYWWISAILLIGSLYVITLKIKLRLTSINSGR